MKKKTAQSKGAKGAARTSKTVSAKSARRPPAGAAFDTEAFVALVKPLSQSAVYPAKAVIFRQGDPANDVYYIRRGQVQIAVLSKQGKEGIIAMLGPGDFFGEGCLAGQPRHMASAIAMADTTVISIAKKDMIRILRDHPGTAEMFMGFLLARNIQVEADLVDQLFNSSERRLARLLLLLANFGKDGKMETVVPKINHDILAARVGTTRARISYFMNKFRQLGFIEYNGGLKVHTSLLNVVVHD